MEKSALQPGDPGHTEITREQRADQLRAREEYKKDVEKRRNDLASRDFTELSIAEKLMRRTFDTKVKHIFMHPEGDIVVETRILSSTERRLAISLSQEMGKTENDTDKYDEVLERIKAFVKGIIVTEGVNDYLESPLCTDDVPISLMMNTLFKTISMVGDSVESFRKQ